MTDPVSVQAEVPGTPEAVWEMIATGRGISTWFVPAEVEEREGGAAVFHLGEDMDAPGTVTAWSPPHRFAVEEPWALEGVEGASIATEFLVEAQAGGTCIVRIVTTFRGAEPGDDLSGVADGWTSALVNLRLCLTHFPGVEAAPVSVTFDAPAGRDEAWETVVAALGVTDADVGDAVLGGVLERRGEQELLVRRPSALLSVYAIGWGERGRLFVRGACFGPTAAIDAGREAAHWRTRLQQLATAARP